jgi:Na+/H+ antiporter NhaD/arsenite permease-like protein
MCIFVMIGGLTKTGVINSLSGALTTIVGTNIALGSLLILLITGILSSVVPNIPLLVGLVPLLKQYLVNMGMANPEFALASFSGKPPETVLPLFYAMLFGATLGGNGTLAGASANIVAAGIAEQHGKTISFRLFTKYGLPVMAVQLVASALYVAIAYLIPR